MSLTKTLLLGSLFAFVICDFPDVGKPFTVRGLNYEYKSKGYMKDDHHYYVYNWLKCDSRQMMCFSWPVARIFIDNKSPVKFEFEKEMPVRYPHLYSEATIFFGANWNEPVDGIECYMDESDLQPSMDKSGEKISYINERGERLEVKLTSSYDQQLRSASLQVETSGRFDLVVEQLPGWEIAQHGFSVSNNWSVQNTKSLSDLFTGTKYPQEELGFLHRGDTTRSFFVCKQLGNGNSRPLVFTSESSDGKLRDISVCLLSKSGNENIGLLSKCYGE